MKARILYIERKFWNKNIAAYSLEKIFEQISGLLSKTEFETEIVKVPFGNSFPDIVKNLLFFKKSPADIYHVTGQIHYLALVLPPERTVLTIHDTGFMHRTGKLRRFIIKKLFLDLPVKRLKYITAVSETTKKSVIELTGCPGDKIRVIENPIQEHFLQSEKKPFNKECPTILQIGITPNKNIPNLIKALNGINCLLRIIGKLDEKLKDALSESGVNYENAVGLTDSEMRAEYENADIVAFCSTFEGFGLPIIEAQAMQKPVITSNLSPMKEVCGGAAYLADPSNISDIKTGIQKIIDENEFRQDIIERGLQNVKRFEPRSIAGLYEKLYGEVLKN